MNPKRLYVEQPLQTGASLTLGSDNAHHVGRVLRARPGDALLLFNGDGRQWRATIDSLARRSIDVTIEAQADATPESALNIVLWQALSRNEKMDLVIQKAVELGVSEIRPVVVERSVVKLDDERSERRRTHWRSVAISAAQQCGRCVVPGIANPATLADALCERAPGSLALFATPDAPRSLSAHLADIEERRSADVLVGPEGGFSNAETAAAIEHGFMPCRVGPRIMRTETAAITLIGILQFAIGDLADR